MSDSHAQHPTASDGIDALRDLLAEEGLEDLHGFDHHEDGCPTCDAIKKIEKALSGTPAEGGPSSEEAGPVVIGNTKAHIEWLVKALTMIQEDLPHSDDRDVIGHACHSLEVLPALLERSTPAANAGETDDRSMIRAAMKHSIETRTPLMGSHATASLYHALGLRYGADGFDAALDAASPDLLAKIKQLAQPYIDQMVAERSSQPEMDWQPIETAPKDKPIMLCVAGFAPSIGRWWPVDGCWSSFDWEGHFESDRDASAYYRGCSYDPTHWKPLPASAPLTSTNGEAGK